MENDETGRHLVRIEPGESRFELVIFGRNGSRNVRSKRKLAMVLDSSLFVTNDTRGIIGGTGLSRVSPFCKLAFLVLHKS